VGSANRAPKIVFVGAGSTVFAKNLIGDILSFGALAESTLTLFDIDPERLKTSEIVASKVASALGAKPVIEATLDRRAAFDGADYIISMFQVGGYRPCTVTDFEVPKKYGLRQTIADTLGIGGIMRGLRTIPVFQDMTAEMEALCPDVTHINYVNPMVMNCRAMARSSKIRTVGLCHSVQHTAQDLAEDIGVPIDEIDYLCAGINHMAFYLKFERDGQDLYPLIRRVGQQGPMPERGHADRSDGGVVGLSDAVRYKVLESFGYFVTESSEHFSEYVPWFIKPGREDLIEQFNIPLDEYIRRCEYQLEGWQTLQAQMEDPATTFDVTRSDEYGASIVHSMETGEPSLIYGNVPNRGLIDNLPAESIVEVPCAVDSRGITPQAVGSLPIQLSALMQTNLNVHELTVEAALTGKREHIYHAALFDPHTAAVLSIDEIHALVDDLIEAHGDYLPQALREA
jgi:alpha-galactosidase